MRVLTSSKALKKALLPSRRKERTIGFVPTMGYLHEGHLSLIRRAKKENDIVVASIFVNPLQFGPSEDFKKYPRNEVRDKKMLAQEKTDFLFMPLVSEFYPKNFQTEVSVKKISKPLCGISRPIHFAGVATVVLKLLNVVVPNILYLGQKDYQQFKVVERMVLDLEMPTCVRMAPIIREKDGLAMSSRNVYLSELERKEALVLSRMLSEAKKAIQSGERNMRHLTQVLHSFLKSAPHGKMDYLEIVDAETLESVVELKNGQTVLIALAVTFGKTRLIDNILVKA